MSSINAKLGIRPGGKRSMMKLPRDKELRLMVTAAVCPRCDRRAARVSSTTPNALYCTVCHHIWEP